MHARKLLQIQPIYKHVVPVSSTIGFSIILLVSLKLCYHKRERDRIKAIPIPAAYPSLS